MDTNMFQFKTNINCGGCLAAVKPHLDKVEGIQEWSVDTANKDKVLTVKGAHITEKVIVKSVEQAGFKIEPIA